MENHKLLETIADIAYIAGSKGFFSGNSRSDILEYIYWAKQFEIENKNTDWNEKDYLLDIGDFTEMKLEKFKS